MRNNRACSCINMRTVSIGVGIITTLLWIPLVYVMAMSVYAFVDLPPSYDYSIKMEVPRIGFLICSLASLAISVLMVVGTVKRNANFMFPWLAIHFANLLTASSLSFSYVIVSIFIESAGTVFFIVSLWLIATSILTFFWGVVYSYYRSLSAPKTSLVSMQIQPPCLSENKILKASLQSDIPYHPV